MYNTLINDSLIKVSSYALLKYAIKKPFDQQVFLDWFNQRAAKQMATLLGKGARPDQIRAPLIASLGESSGWRAASQGHGDAFNKALQAQAYKIRNNVQAWSHARPSQMSGAGTGLSRDQAVAKLNDSKPFGFDEMQG